MDEPTHIMRDGVRVDLSHEQKAEYRALWAQGEAKMQAQRQQDLRDAESKKKILARLGLTEDELALLRGI